MNCEIIIDGNKYTFGNVDSVSTSQTDSKFTVTIISDSKASRDVSSSITSPRPVSIQNNIPDEEMLDNLIGEEIAKKGIPDENASTKYQENLKTTPSKSRVRVVSETAENVDVDKLVLTASPTTEQKTNIISTVNQPSSTGIIIPDKTDIIGGKKFELDNETSAILARTRNEFGIFIIDDKQREDMTLADNNEEGSKKNFKKNIILKSELFNELNATNKKVALQTLVMKEQSITHDIVINNGQRDEIEHFLYVEEPPRLVVSGVANEKEGIGEFYYEEMVSVYRGKSTRTRVNND